jgi:hypothetical protein
VPKKGGRFTAADGISVQTQDHGLDWLIIALQHGWAGGIEEMLACRSSQKSRMVWMQWLAVEL